MWTLEKIKLGEYYEQGLMHYKHGRRCGIGIAIVKEVWKDKYGGNMWSGDSSSSLYLSADVKTTVNPPHCANCRELVDRHSIALGILAEAVVPIQYSSPSDGCKAGAWSLKRIMKEVEESRE